MQKVFFSNKKGRDCECQAPVALIVVTLSVIFLLRHKHPRARVARSWSQHSPHTEVTRCDCSHTLVSSFAQLHSHEANIPSRTAWTSCKALLSCGGSLEFPMGKSLLLPSPANPEANHYQAGKRCSHVLRFVLFHKSC